MDWEDIVKHAENCLEKRVSTISAALKSNQLQINKLVSLCDALDKHFKNSLLKKSAASPELALTERRSEPRLRSPAGLKRPTDFKKKLKDEEDAKTKASEPKNDDVAKEQSLKKMESRTGLKKGAETAEGKKEEDAKHKKTTSARHEDVKKNKEDEAKNEDAKPKRTLPKPSDKTPKKTEEKEEKPKKELKTEEKPKKDLKTEEKPKKDVKTDEKTLKKTDNLKKNEKVEEIPKKSEEIEELQDPDAIDLSAKPVHYDQSLIQQKLSSMSLETHSKSSENFLVSTGVQILLHSLNKLNSEKFHLTKNSPPNQFLWIFKVLFLFLNKEFTEDTLWSVTKDFLSGGKGSRIQPDIGNFFITISNEFDFSEENLEKVEKEVSGIQVDVKKFGKNCEVSAVLAYFIKEILLFGGVNMEEGPDWRLKRRWEYKLSHLVN